ncbi:zinc ribbon domain-containing protein [uncultured Methanoregula sp.]|uniref:zinc ribbon domain-containing protein n=1 Tax=uncultured Methanoregula sp. TaxID=1005933 RepID=UPI002AAAC030|nr:zinc ribbon domain-containing protein [uncultured Methanoregula sp.]
MPYCPECGKRVAAQAKFCRFCGASQAEETDSPESAVASPPKNSICGTCNSILLPDDKFCGNCGSKAGSAPPAPVEAPVVSFPAPQIPLLACPSCGAPANPDAKFCGICGAPAGQSPAAKTAPSEVTAGYTCASCGSPLAGSEKFCGICGKAAVAARPVPSGAAVTAATAGKVCGSCSAPVKENTKFCGMCGAPAGTSAPPAQVMPRVSPQVPDRWEEVLGVIPNARKMKMFGAAFDTYTIVVTGQRMILARLTQPMLNAAIAEANAKAKAEGKGFLGVVGDQLAVSFGFGKRYETMPPEQVLHETPGNVAIANPRITAIRLTLLDTKKSGMDWNEFKMTVESMDGKYEYIIAEDDRFLTLLTTAYGDRVKIPPGLFTSGPVRVRFF